MTLLACEMSATVQFEHSLVMWWFEHSLVFWVSVDCVKRVILLALNPTYAIH